MKTTEPDEPDFSIDNLAPFGTLRSCIACSPSLRQLLLCRGAITCCSNAAGGIKQTHCLIGPYWPMLIVTYGIIMVPGALFCMYGYNSFDTMWNSLIIVVWTTTFVSLSLTAFRDPGIVRHEHEASKDELKLNCSNTTSATTERYRRNRLEGAVTQEKEDVESLEIASDDQYQRGEQHSSNHSGEKTTVLHAVEAEHRRLLGNNKSYSEPGNRRLPPRVRYCDTCDLEQTGDVEHCHVIGRCIYDYDHFCPWVNNAVGRNNSTSFYVFVTSIAIFLIVCFAGGVIGGIADQNSQNLRSSAKP